MNEDSIYSSESEKQPKKISLVSFIVSVICVALAAVMTTYVCCLNVWKDKQSERIVYVEKELPNQFDVIFSQIFEKYSWLECTDFYLFLGWRFCRSHGFFGTF